MRSLLVLVLLALGVPALARRHCPTTIPCAISSSTTSSTTSSSSSSTRRSTSTSTTSSTSSTVPINCVPTLNAWLHCTNETDYDYWSLDRTTLPICYGTKVGCDAFFFNASVCSDPNVELGLIWAGLILDRVVDGIVTKTTGQTFPTENILNDPYGAGYETDPGHGGLFCSTPLELCPFGLIHFDPILTEVGHNVIIRATYLIKRVSDGIIYTFVSDQPVPIVVCP